MALHQFELFELINILEKLEFQQEKWLKVAEQYLEPSRLSIREQVLAIANHPNQGMWIDNVLGVELVEFRKWTTNCAGFLNLIGYKLG